MNIKQFLKIRYILTAVAGIILIYLAIGALSELNHDYMPSKETVRSVPLDPESPWPKFRANALQNGRSAVAPEVDPNLRPWTYRTGKGIFSSPVIDGEGNVYVGSADHYFYALNRDGSLKWKVKTGEVIDSSALLDDKGRVYVGSGDAHVYCMDRSSGDVLWKSRAHTVQEVEEQFGLKTYNVDWFEGNIAMLADGTIIAPNDNYLIYAMDRDSGKRLRQYIINEMGWSLPAVNVKTGRMFSGSQFMALKNVFCFNTETAENLWTSGGLGSNASSPLLTNDSERGVVILGGYDGYVRAYSQKNGRELWKQGLRGHIYSSPAQLSDGTIIMPSSDGTVYALEPKSGKIIWAYDTLEPIRSSPAIDNNDLIYVGSGEGRLFCINPDGTLRWSYLCIDEDRNDLNSSPALGKDGVAIAGENGGIFFVPYDYPLTQAGKADIRSEQGPGEDLPDEGAFLLYTTRFGGTLTEAPESINGNQALCFTLFVRKEGDTIKSLINKEELEVHVTGDPDMQVHVSANRQFITLFPRETWSSSPGELEIKVSGTYRTDPRRFGLKFFNGSKGGSFDKTFTFTLPPRKEAPFPYRIPSKAGDVTTTFAMSRFAAPKPNMLPSWNQIGFDSLHYLSGIVEGNKKKMLVWVITGKLENGETVVNPELNERFPLTLDYDRGLLSFHNYDGFKINFVGSWDMPFGEYRIDTKADPASGRILESPTLSALTLCDEIEFYGRFLKLMGMSDFKTGHMAAFGGLNMKVQGKERAPEGTGKANFTLDKTSATVTLQNGTLKKGDHVYSLLLVNRETGHSFPLYYTKRTEVKASDDGTVTGVTVRFNEGKVKGKVRLYYMVDTFPAAMGELSM
jgi:outer membrane protein assembly factor BamB